MRTLSNLSLALSLIFVVFMSSCGGGANPLGSFTCKVDGDKYDADGITITAVEVNGETQVNIATTKLSGETFAFTIYKFTGNGTYQLGPNNAGNGIFPNTGIYTATLGASSQFGSAVEGGSGEMEVTDYDGDSMKANFEFTGVDDSGAKVVITDGKLNASVF